MSKSAFEKNGGYFVDGVAYMDCKVTGEPVPNVSEEAVSVIGSRAVMGMVGMPNEKPKKVSTGRPAGWHCLLYTSPSPRDRQKSRMPSSA